jgi:iron complex transport system ATP-binding protein
MIRIDQLTIDLAGRRVLDGVSLDLPKGQVTVILGPNGAGKSTLLRAMAGLLPPNSGTITLDGAPLAALPLRDRAKRIGYLPQNGAPAWAVGTTRESRPSTSSSRRWMDLKATPASS